MMKKIIILALIVLNSVGTLVAQQVDNKSHDFLNLASIIAKDLTGKGIDISNDSLSNINMVVLINDEVKKNNITQPQYIVEVNEITIQFVEEEGVFLHYVRNYIVFQQVRILNKKAKVSFNLMHSYNQLTPKIIKRYKVKFRKVKDTWVI
jgi:hypothetical protein